MIIKLSGDLARLGAVSLPDGATKALISRAKDAKKTVHGTLGVPVGNKVFTANASYNPHTNTLQLEVYF